MTNFSSLFLDKKRKTDIALHVVTEKSFPGWLKKQSADVKAGMKNLGFTGRAGAVVLIPGGVVAGVGTPFSIYALSPAVDYIRRNFAADFIKGASFSLHGVDAKDLENAFTSWALAGYEFTPYKKPSGKTPALVWNKKADKKRVRTLIESIFMVRDLVTTPSNDMGPGEIEVAARKLAGAHKAKISVIKDKDLLTKNFPLIYAVGDGSPRRPRLIDINWGNPNSPKVTIVGKGVAFDTGGLNLKPTGNMALMKKDMGGAAHALALAHLIMSAKLKVRLRILIPAVENSVDGHSFRPGDVFKSRKGLTVENTNTDAEGRLILADTLTYACESKPGLLIDFATLTGSARAALGPDIPAFFSNNEKLAEQLKKISFTSEDPLWPMPLWQPYNIHNNSAVADMQNSSGVPGDLMYSALFLERFLTGKPDWVHIDTYAWEHIGKPGRPRGGADCGLRAVFALLEEKY
ncbi:MAG TPA: leucyl aminopeptidase family protein [Alphaproteobacteria bacterium]|nr:leucyl aminopeptidase family protein [Alphaproteobacteria bacterium]